MSNLFNPYALTALGKPLQQRQSPELRVEAPHISRAQLDMAQHTFVRFLDQARLSRVPNPTQQGRLADGTPYRIVTASGAPIMQVWPVQPQVGNPKGEIYGGYLYITDKKQFIVDVITEDGKHTGKWGVRYIDKGVRLIPLVAGNKQNIVIDGPKGSKIPYLYATNRERGYLFSGGIPYIKLSDWSEYHYLQNSVSKVVNSSGGDNARAYVLKPDGFIDSDIKYGYLEISGDVRLKNTSDGTLPTKDTAPTITPPLHVIGTYSGNPTYSGLTSIRKFSRSGHQVIQEAVREIDAYSIVKDVPGEPNRKIINTRNAGIVYPDSDKYSDITNAVNGYYDNGGDYKSSEKILRLFNVTGGGLEKVKDLTISDITSIHPERMERTAYRNSNGRWIRNPIGGGSAFEGKTSIPVSYEETDQKNKISSWKTGDKSYTVQEEFDRDFSATYSNESEQTLYHAIGEFFDFSGRFIEDRLTIKEEYSYSGNCSRDVKYNYIGWYYPSPDRDFSMPGMNPAIYNSQAVLTHGNSGSAASSITTEETYFSLITRSINGMDLEVNRENVTVKTNYQVAVNWYKKEVSAKFSSTIEVEYMVKDLDILLVDHYLDLIIYRESVRSHKYTAEYYKGARPSLSDMVESDPAYVVIHNKKEVRRYTGELKRVSPPYTYMKYSCFPGFEWAELGGPRERRNERMMYEQRLESLEFGYIATNIMYMARPTAYYAIDNETVTYTKSPSTGSSLIRIKIGDSVISLLVDKVSTHDYEKVMDSLKLDTSVLPSGVI